MVCTVRVKNTPLIEALKVWFLAFVLMVFNTRLPMLFSHPRTHMGGELQLATPHAILPLIEMP